MRSLIHCNFIQLTERSSDSISIEATSCISQTPGIINLFATLIHLSFLLYIKFDPVVIEIVNFNLLNPTGRLSFSTFMFVPIKDLIHISFV